MVKFGWETYSQTFSTTVFMDISQPLAASASSSSATGVGRLVMDPSLAHLTPQFNVWPDKSPISQLAARINPSSTYNTAQIQLDFNDGKFFMPMQCWCFFYILYHHYQCKCACSTIKDGGVFQYFCSLSFEDQWYAMELRSLRKAQQSYQHPHSPESHQ